MVSNENLDESMQQEMALDLEAAIEKKNEEKENLDHLSKDQQKMKSCLDAMYAVNQEGSDENKDNLDDDSGSDGDGISSDTEEDFDQQGLETYENQLKEEGCDDDEDEEEECVEDL